MFGEPGGATPSPEATLRAGRLVGGDFPDALRRLRVLDWKTSRALAAAGADFVALGDAVWDAAATSPEAVARGDASICGGAHDDAICRDRGARRWLERRGATPSIRTRRCSRRRFAAGRPRRAAERRSPAIPPATSPSAPISAAITSPRCARPRSGSPPMPSDAAAMTLIGEIYHDGLRAQARRRGSGALVAARRQRRRPAGRLRVRRGAADAAPASPPDKAAARGAIPRRRPTRAISARSTISACWRCRACPAANPTSPPPPNISAAPRRPATAIPPIPTACCCARAKASRSTPTRRRNG